MYFADFARPVGAGRQLSALAHLFERDEADLAHAAIDPAELRLIGASAAESIRWLPEHGSFRHDRFSGALTFP
ncbi:hypothetical protein AB0M46_38065 [Dactylosporangium sp. NPDC051485]|uniref:hypothetical protein n=1 Tax=Dactylosporangium sp. NPDC051485 TaxID=3154846 RepID=UPI0034441F9C